MRYEILPIASRLIALNDTANVEINQDMQNYEIAYNEAVKEIKERFGHGYFAPVKQALMLWWLTPFIVDYKMATPERMIRNGHKFKKTMRVRGMYYLNT